jgi:hypothetical protein
MSFQKCQIVGVNISPTTYHQPQKHERGSPEFVMSQSALKSFGKCPSKWKDGAEEDDTASMAWGNLVDTLVLTPQLFAERYAIRPETYKDEKGNVKDWHPNSNTCKAWLEACHKYGREAISRGKESEASKAVLRLKRDVRIAAFLAVCKFQVELRGFWKDDVTGLEIPVRCLLDAVPEGDSEFGNDLGDLKTSKDVSLYTFRRQAVRLGYHIQSAFSLDFFNAASGQQRNQWRFLLQESDPPYQTGRRICTSYENPQDAPPQNFIQFGRDEYKRMMRNYCICLKAGVWGDFDTTDESVEGWSVLEADPWAVNDALFAPKFQLPESAEDLRVNVEEITP